MDRSCSHVESFLLLVFCTRFESFWGLEVACRMFLYVGSSRWRMASSSLRVLGFRAVRLDCISCVEGFLVFCTRFEMRFGVGVGFGAFGSRMWIDEWERKKWEGRWEDIRGIAATYMLT